MSKTVARAIQLKVRKLSEIEKALKQGERREITCLTSIKSLCKEPDLARRFVTSRSGSLHRLLMLVRQVISQRSTLLQCLLDLESFRTLG